MDNRKLALTIVVFAIIVGIIAATTLLIIYWQPEQGDHIDLVHIAGSFRIENISWKTTGDIPVIEVTLMNDGNVDIQIEEISVRRDFDGSPEYVWKNPVGLTTDSNIIPIGAKETFEWNIQKSNAPSDFLAAENKYVVWVMTTDKFWDREGTTAPSSLGF